MNIEEATAEARENVARNFTTEPCVIRALLNAIDRERATVIGLTARVEREREKVRVLREACESICEEWGHNYNCWPIGAGNKMEKHATAALAATEDAQ